MRESSALGAAAAAGFCLGLWNFEDIVVDGNTFQPSKKCDYVEKLCATWQKGISCSSGWASKNP
jgi:glycerol kinase